MKSNTIYLGPLACGVLLAGAMVASGHNGATGIIGERMMGMMMLSEQIKALAPVAEAPTSSDAETVIAAAEMIAMHAGPAMTELFPEGSVGAPSEARPEIWERWQEFSAYADQLGVLGEELGLAGEILFAPAPEAKEAPVPAPAKPVPTEWERMDFAWLMGLSPNRAIDVDMTTTASVGAESVENLGPTSRPLGAIYNDIAATCSSCHASFRR
ncbi:c-type cytochrome [Devosia sp. LjRoot3]|jgi:cytochrome c556|uniref:c-type cytochrome n=1 Tax=Devosia sp. LjRoot3 TaxID=3342319 RepID=UPI003ED0EEFC